MCSLVFEALMSWIASNVDAHQVLLIITNLGVNHLFVMFGLMFLGYFLGQDKDTVFIFWWCIVRRILMIFIVCIPHDKEYLSWVKV